MSTVDLKSDSEKIKDEANASASTILASLGLLEEKSSKIVTEALRQRRVEEISKIVKDLNEMVHTEEKRIQDCPSLYEGKEVVVYFFLAEPDDGGARYDATIVGTWARELTEAYMRLQENVWYASPQIFLRLVEDLKQEILEGKHDEKLRTNSARVIYDLLKDRVLLSRLSPERTEWRIIRRKT